MLNDDIMLLDAYSSIYVWIGNGSNKFEKNGAYKTANRYIESIKDDRDKSSVQIVEVEAGREPPSFTVHFPEWRAEIAQRWLDDDPAKRLADLYPADKGTGVSGGSSSSNTAPKKPLVPGKPANTNPSAPAWAKKDTSVQEESKKVESAEDKSKYLDPATNKMDYEQLKGAFPTGVDPARKEAYLPDDKFQEIFGMTPAAFNDLKQWKKNDLKKAKGLF
jgi:advillin